MRGHGAKFKRKMEEAVAALLTHRNHEEAARAVGIGTATLLRWEKRPEFQQAYRAAGLAAHIDGEVKSTARDRVIDRQFGPGKMFDQPFSAT
jgi:hypothetical protein